MPSTATETGLSDDAGTFMRAEIEEQPRRWVDLVAGQQAEFGGAAELLSDRIESVVLVARGSSDHAAIYAQYLLPTLLGRPAWLATPSVSSVLHRDVFTRNSLVVAVSQSGSSPDLIATLESARRCGAPTISFTNDPASAMAQIVDVHVDISAGTERAVAATKSYTTEVVALQSWARFAAGHAPEAVVEDVLHASRQAVSVLQSCWAPARNLARELAGADRMLFVGRGTSMATAKEAALKVMETCSVAASGWSAADAKHGPLGQVLRDTPVFLLTTTAAGRDSIEALEADIAARGGLVIPVGHPLPQRTGRPSLIGVIPLVHETLQPALEIIPLQMFALESALIRGFDPDRPFGLTKVTRTI